MFEDDIWCSLCRDRLYRLNRYGIVYVLYDVPSMDQPYKHACIYHALTSSMRFAVLVVVPVSESLLCLNLSPDWSRFMSTLLLH